MHIETEPMPLAPHRRVGERRLEALANSALLKVLQYAVTSIALPVIAWGIGTMLGRMDKFEQQMQAQSVVTATSELRMLSAEKQVAEAVAAERNLRDRVLALEFQVMRSASKRGNE